jgi:thiol-disulfide isomerase/thioredoxin
MFRLFTAVLTAGVATGGVTLAVDDAAKSQAAADKVQADKVQIPKKINWYTSLAKAREAAKKENKILFVDFYATWCGPCKMLDAQTFPDEAFRKVTASMVCAKIDTDKDQLSAINYQILSVPTLMFFTPTGEKIARFNGANEFLPAQLAVKTVKGILDDERSLAELEKQVEKQVKEDASDPVTTLRLAMIHVRRDSVERAEALLAAVERADSDNKAKVAAERKATVERAYQQLIMARVESINELLRTDKTADAVKAMRSLLATKYAPPEVKTQAADLIEQFSTDQDDKK